MCLVGSHATQQLQAAPTVLATWMEDRELQQWIATVLESAISP